MWACLTAFRRYYDYVKPRVPRERAGNDPMPERGTRWVELFARLDRFSTVDNSQQMAGHNQHLERFGRIG